MTPLLESLSLPARAYEAFVPFALWLMAEGFTNEDATLALCTPMLLAVTKCQFVSKRQHGWIDAVYRLLAMVYLILGKRIG